MRTTRTTQSSDELRKTRSFNPAIDPAGGPSSRATHSEHSLPRPLLCAMWSFCAQIDTLQAEMAGMRAQIEALKGKRLRARRRLAVAVRLTQQ